MAQLERLLAFLAWILLIIVGVLWLAPDWIVCFQCGPTVSRIAPWVLIAVGVVGLLVRVVAGRR